MEILESHINKLWMKKPCVASMGGDNHLTGHSNFNQYIFHLFTVMQICSSTIKKCWSFLPIATCFHIWTALPLPPTGLTSTNSFFLFLTLQGFQPFVSVYIFIFSPEKSPVWRSPRAIDRLERPQTQFEPVSVNLHPFRFLWIRTAPIHMQNSIF